MAVLGKRKSREEPAISEGDAAAIFRRHFEAQFQSLPGTKSKSKKATPVDATSNDESEDDEEDAQDSEESGEDGEKEDDEDEWGGLSDEDAETEEVPVIEVVDHSSVQSAQSTSMSKRELKAFMSSRPPDQASLNAKPSTSAPSSSSSTLPEDAPSLLAQDLELRRLLAESHLLSPALSSTRNNTTPKAFASGRTRHKATDLRVQALGSKTSILKQEKMPMNMRKGIVATANAREAKRRKEAKENGIILERETSKKSTRRRNRDFGVDRPGVGRLKGAELRLSDKDIRKVESGRDAFGRRGRS